MAIIRVKTDYPTIQAAVDAASSGDIILVERGVYNEQVTISTSYIQIIGEEGAVLDGKFQLGRAFFLNSVNNVKIKLFQIKNYNTDAIYINYGSFNVITKNVLKDNSNAGIELYTALDTQISDNIICGNGYYGIYNYQSRNTRIEGNTISSNGSSGIYLYYTDATSDIYHNHIFNNYNYGIICYGNNSRIALNKVHGNNSYGIYVYQNCLVKGNEVESNGSDGIYSSYVSNTIRENKVSSNTLNGISVYGNYSTIFENFSTKNRNGILIGSSLNYVARNVAKENTNFDIVRLRPNNQFKNNECEKSNPPGLCCEKEHKECEPEIEEVQ